MNTSARDTTYSKACDPLHGAPPDGPRHQRRHSSHLGPSGPGRRPRLHRPDPRRDHHLGRLAGLPRLPRRHHRLERHPHGLADQPALPIRTTPHARLLRRRLPEGPHRVHPPFGTRPCASIGGGQGGMRHLPLRRLPREGYADPTHPWGRPLPDLPYSLGRLVPTPEPPPQKTGLGSYFFSDRT